MFLIQPVTISASSFFALAF